ncbi:MAG: hypothetical protein Q7S08_05245 [bacterium]|nr:hypothetical protein [bacterium]
MDEIRDTRRSDLLSKFLDGHIVRTSPFGRNASGEKSYRRAERLVAALHLLTSHVREDEPVRRSIRVTAIKLLSDILALRDEMRISNSSKIRSAQSTIRELISLVRMLGVSGLVSIQNADIIVEAIDELGNFLHLSQRTQLSESVVFSRDDLLSGGLPAEKRTNLSVKDKALLLGINTDREASRITDSLHVKDGVKDTTVQMSRTDDMISTRSREVLAILHSGGEVGIRDISSNLPEYSEKMVQRELASLVAAGRVKKSGLKRWSRYSII